MKLIHSLSVISALALAGCGGPSGPEAVQSFGTDSVVFACVNNADVAAIQLGQGTRTPFVTMAHHSDCFQAIGKTSKWLQIKMTNDQPRFIFLASMELGVQPQEPRFVTPEWRHIIYDSTVARRATAVTEVAKVPSDSAAIYMAIKEDAWRLELGHQYKIPAVNVKLIELEGAANNWK